jgi:hypothetical protein
LESKHPNSVDKPVEYFQTMHEGMKKQIGVVKNMVAEDKFLLTAFYLISFQISQNKVI